MIDSHCHLAGEAFGPDLDDVVRRARDAGVERTLVILAAGDRAEATQADRVLALWPETRFAVGVHPHSAGAFADEPARSARIVAEQLGGTPMARAIGEIGLDYHYDFAPQEVQQQVFRAQLALARERDLPVVIHTREADDDTVVILGEGGAAAVRGVLHCFTGGPALASAGLALGLHVSLSGIATFPKAVELRETARLIPLDRLLVETDSPFLAPAPYRGRRNEPAYVTRVVDVLADLYGIAPEILAQVTRANFHALFRP